MKKWSYIVGGFVLGIVVTLSSSSAFAAVESLLGKKVTGEMDVVVNGSKLQNKGAVIDGVTNAPVRALSDALGAELSLDGNTIFINSVSEVGDKVLFDGKEYTKEELLKMKQSAENYLNVVIPEKEERDKKRYETLMTEGLTENAKREQEASEKDITERKAGYTERLEKINEALKAFE